LAFSISDQNTINKAAHKLKPKLVDRIITGTVTDAGDGSPIPGVNVVIKGTTTGTITDFDGKYRIDLPDSLNVLVFSYVGYESFEKELDGETVVDIALKASDVGLEEVVVIGYGTVKKSSLTASVVSLHGRAAGVSIKDEEPKTWKRSNKSENAVKLTIGDNEDNEVVPLVGTEMKVIVDGFRARIFTNYFFYAEDGNYEGNFKIRLPAGASPYYFAFGPTEYFNKEDDDYESFEDYYDLDIYDYLDHDSLQIDGDKILASKSGQWKQPKEAKVVPVDKAAYAYSETVKGQVDPLLAEWAGADVFNCRVFPLEEGELHRVVIGYDVNLTSIGQDLVFNLNIPKTTGTTIVDLDIAKLDGVQTSTDYKQEVTLENNRLKLHLENPDSENIEIRHKQPGNILLIDENNNYFASSLKVKLPKGIRKSTVKKAVFAIDVSASSNPDKFNVWLKLMKAILINNQENIKQFNVMFFNIETFWFNDSYLANTPENVNRLMKYCDKLSLEGATDIGAAVSEFCDPSWLEKRESKNIFLLSDGSVTWGKEELYSITSEIGKNNTIFVYNTGISGTDMNVLDHLSRESGGTLFSVTGEDEIDAASKAFNYDVWEISSLKLNGCNDLLIEGRPKYLYDGQKIRVSGKGTPSSNAKLLLKLKNGRKKRKLRFGFNHRLNSSLSKRVYGQLAVNQIESFDFFAEKYAVPYAVYYRIPAKTCSMLMLENESDYEEYDIFFEEKSKNVKKNQVNNILVDIIREMQKSDGLEKDKLIKHLEKLSNLSYVDFEFSDTLRKMIDKLPNEYFRIKPSVFKCENHLSNMLSDSVLEELSKGTPKYNIIEQESDSLLTKFGKYDALKMLSTIVERNPNNGVLLRDVAFSAMKLGLSEHAFYLLKKVTEKVPHEPHSYQFIAQILTDMEMYDLAMIYYEIAYTAEWNDRFEDIKAIIGLDYLRFLQLTEKSGFKLLSNKIAAKRKKSLISFLENDEHDLDIELDSINLMITMNWNTDDSDIDLYVVDPLGDTCSYKKTNTKSGGYITDDNTEGYGPEMYINPSKNKGKYKIMCEYYDDSDSRVSTRTQVYVIIYKNWGKENEKVIRKVVALRDEKEMQDVLELQID